MTRAKNISNTDTEQRVTKPVATKKPVGVKVGSKIKKEQNLAELVFNYPKTAEVLMDFGLHCVGCGAMQFDTVEAGAKIHGFTDAEIEDLVARLNEVIEFGE